MSESIEPCGQVCGIPRAKHQTEEHPWKPWDDFGDQCGGCAHTRGSHANTGSCDFCPCDTFADVTEPVLPPPDYSLMEDAGTG